MANTRAVVVLDRSGSMLNMKDATIRGFNEWKQSTVEATEKTPGDIFCTIVLFNDTVDVPVKDQLLQDMNDLDESRYRCRGQTALNDALGDAIQGLDEQMQDDDRALVVVITDGRENASREYTTSMIKDMIRAKEDLGNWSFVYLSADPRAFQDAADRGIAVGNTRAMTRNEYMGGQTWVETAEGTQAYAMATDPGTQSFWNPTGVPPGMGTIPGGLGMPPIQRYDTAPAPMTEAQRETLAAAIQRATDQAQRAQEERLIRGPISNSGEARFPGGRGERATRQVMDEEDNRGMVMESVTTTADYPVAPIPQYQPIRNQPVRWGEGISRFDVPLTMDLSRHDPGDPEV